MDNMINVVNNCHPFQGNYQRHHLIDEIFSVCARRIPMIRTFVAFTICVDNSAIALGGITAAVSQSTALTSCIFGGHCEGAVEQLDGGFPTVSVHDSNDTRSDFGHPPTRRELFGSHTVTAFKSAPHFRISYFFKQRIQRTVIFRKKPFDKELIAAGLKPHELLVTLLTSDVSYLHLANSEKSGEHGETAGYQTLIVIEKVALLVSVCKIIRQFEANNGNRDRESFRPPSTKDFDHISPANTQRSDDNLILAGAA